MEITALNKLIDRQNSIDEKLEMILENHYQAFEEVMTWNEIKKFHLECKSQLNWLHKPSGLERMIKDLNLIFREVTKSDFESLRREWIYKRYKQKLN
ncbi:MAG: hypothetical protein JXR88_12455 [Clostridia bacterium]|nr:hypothetical protein [Clostridia bacterium]